MAFFFFLTKKKRERERRDRGGERLDPKGSCIFLITYLKIEVECVFSCLTKKNVGKKIPCLVYV